MNVSKIERLEKLITEQQYDERRAVELKAQIGRETESLNKFRDARQICQVVLASTQVQFKIDVEALMTLAIQSVFNRFEFQLEWKTGATRSDLNFNVLDRGNVMNLEDDLGCSILDVISLSSRPVFHQYQKDQSRKLFIADEPAKWVGQGVFLERTCELLRQISHERGYQLIIITHEKRIAEIADKAFWVQNDGVQSTISELDDIMQLGD